MPGTIIFTGNKRIFPATFAVFTTALPTIFTALNLFGHASAGLVKETKNMPTDRAMHAIVLFPFMSLINSDFSYGLFIRPKRLGIYI